MKERPILFSGPMVRAILEGRKTQTRRVIKNTGTYAIEDHHGIVTAKRERAALAKQSRYGQPGDRLWVRETHSIRVMPCAQSRNGAVWYRASEIGAAWDGEIKWKPSIHMPRWASRIILEITGIRVERLQELSYHDAIAEGICDLSTDEFKKFGIDKEVFAQHPVRAFQLLWQSINGTGSWYANPWVWVVDFKRVV